jgi:hypothetical protein
VDLGNGVVYDTVTKLLWLKDTNYFKKRMRLDDAQKACENLVLMGLSAWRLPTSEELKRMIPVFHQQESNPFSFDENDYAYWTNERMDGSYQYTINFRDRQRNYHGKTLTGGQSIWCVR